MAVFCAFLVLSLGSNVFLEFHRGLRSPGAGAGTAMVSLLVEPGQVSLDRVSLWDEPVE